MTNATPRLICQAVVLDASEVTPLHFQLRLLAPPVARVARPGQFVHILTPPNTDGWEFDPLLRRAFSIMNVEKGKETMDVLFRVGGRGTKKLATAKKNDKIDLLGPLGQPFDVSPFVSPSNELAGSESSGELRDSFHVKQIRRKAIIIGGGVGVPPLVYLSSALREIGVETWAVIGAREANELIGENELRSSCTGVSVTTDDGSTGFNGRVTDLLPDLIEQLTWRFTWEGTSQLWKPVVYSCGPWPMLKAVSRICQDADVKCQVSLEENMPCGIGVCNGCVVRTRQPVQPVVATPMNIGQIQEPAPDAIISNSLPCEWSPYNVYRRVCVQGPACWADEIDWDHQD